MSGMFGISKIFRFCLGDLVQVKDLEVLGGGFFIIRDEEGKNRVERMRERERQGRRSFYLFLLVCLVWGGRRGGGKEELLCWIWFAICVVQDFVIRRGFNVVMLNIFFEINVRQ